MAKWNSYPRLTASQLDGADLVPISDDSEADTEKSKTASLDALRTFLGAGITVGVQQAAHGLAVGDVVRFDGTDYVQATADTAANSEAVGVVTVAETDAFAYQTAGVVSTLSGLTPGELYYLQDNGSLGTSAGTVEKPVLIATSSTSAVLILAISGGGGGGTGDMTKAVYDTDDDGTVDSADVASRVEETVATDTDSGASHAIDCDSGTVHVLTLTADCTVSFSNVPSGGFGITLELKQDATGSRTVTWPGTVTWAGGTPPTLSTAASAVDVVTLYTPDGGSTWRAALVGLSFS